MGRLPAVIVVCLAAAGGAGAASLDPLLAESQLIASIGSETTGMAWAPDGSNRLFVLAKAGTVHVVQLGAGANGAVTATRLASPFTVVTRADGGPLYTGSECGLIGI